MKNKRNIFGFTLLELLIVIAIIGILVSIGVVSYSSAQKKSRDSRRTADLKAIQNGWEQYYADNNGSYPDACDSDVSAYMPPGVPNDPKTSDSYAVSCDPASYCFCATMETTGANAGAGCNYGSATKTEFCVSNLQ